MHQSGRSWFGFRQEEREGDFPPRPSVELRAQRPGGGSAGFLRWLLFYDLTSAVLKPEAIAVHLEDVDMMGEAIEQRAGQPLGAEHAGPGCVLAVCASKEKRAIEFAGVK